MRLPLALALTAGAVLVGSPGALPAQPGPAGFVRSVDTPGSRSSRARRSSTGA